MANLICLTLEGKQQGLISRGCGTLDSIGNRYQTGKKDVIEPEERLTIKYRDITTSQIMAGTSGYSISNESVV